MIDKTTVLKDKVIKAASHIMRMLGDERVLSYLSLEDLVTDLLLSNEYTIEFSYISNKEYIFIRYYSRVLNSFVDIELLLSENSITVNGTKQPMNSMLQKVFRAYSESITESPESSVFEELNAPRIISLIRLSDMSAGEYTDFLRIVDEYYKDAQLMLSSGSFEM